MFPLINSVISGTDYVIADCDYIIAATDFIITATDYRINRHSDVEARIRHCLFSIPYHCHLFLTFAARFIKVIHLYSI